MKKVLLIISSILIVSIVFILTRFNLYYVNDRNGYVVSVDNIYDNLLSENVNKKNLNVKATKVSNYENFYSFYRKVYIGDLNKKVVDKDYPIISKDNSQATSLSGTTKLISSDFKESKSYLGMSLINGEIFNQADNSKADNNIYYFFKLSNGLFVNSFEINYKNSLKDNIIPINSIIYFNENFIRYYYVSDGYYKYNEINLVNSDGIIVINEKEYNYYEFLEKLNLIEIVKEEPTTTVITTQPVIENPNVTEPVIYIKPEVSVKDFKVFTYSVSSNITIKDESNQIVEYPTFTFYLGDKIYLKKQLVGSGDFSIQGLEPSKTFRVVGTYTYKSQDGKEIKVTFYDQELTTKSLEDLETVNLSVVQGKYYSNKVEFSEVKITSSLNVETLKGVYKAQINIGNNKYSITKTKLTKLLSGETVSLATKDNLKSNSNYDYEIVFYDKFNNILPLSGNKGTTKTLKEIPFVDVDIKAEDFKATVKTKINNPDDVLITNFIYEIYDSNNNLVTSENFNIGDTLNIGNLYANEEYNLIIYADYNLDDGNGNYLKQIMVNTSFKTVKMDFGILRLNFSINDEKTSYDRASLDVSITNVENELDDLIEVLSKIHIYLTDESGVQASEIILTGDELNVLKEPNGIKNLLFENLKSKTTYFINVEAFVKQGTKEYNVKDISQNLYAVTTKIEPAKFNRENTFYSSNKITFDANITDNDNTIIDEYATMYIYKDGVVVDYRKIETNKEFEKFTFKNLDPNTEYTFVIKVVGVITGITYEDDILDSFTITTSRVGDEPANGTIYLNSLLSKIESKNQFDITNNDKWLSSGSGVDLKSVDSKSNSSLLTLGIKAKGARYYNYYFPELAGKQVLVSFKLKYEINNYIVKNSDYATFSVLNSKNNSSAMVGLFVNNFSNNTSTITYDSYDKNNIDDYLYVVSKVFTLNSNGYLNFKLNSPTSAYVTNVEIADVNIVDYDELQNDDEYNSKCNLNTGDFGACYNTIFSTYKEDANYYNANISLNYTEKIDALTALIGTENYILNLEYTNNTRKENKNENITEEELNNGINLDLLKNSEYTFKLKLIANLEDGKTSEYILDQLTFTTETEIRSINNVNQWRYAHNKGKYILNSNLEFSSSPRFMNSTLTFFGELDFNGHTVINKTSTDLVYALGSSGKIKNAVVNLVFGNDTATSLVNRYGLVYSNSGTITNVYLTANKASEGTIYNRSFSNSGFIVTTNYGTIENFAVELNMNLNIAYGFGPVANTNYGTIRNGYVTGSGRYDMTNNTFATTYVTSKRVGGIVGQASTFSNISNVYSTIDIDPIKSDCQPISKIETTNCQTTNEAAYGNIIGYASYGTVKNVFSVGGGLNRTLGGNGSKFAYDMNVGYSSSSSTYQEMYYINNNKMPNSLSTNLNYSYLKNVSFINKILNADYNKFIVDDYILAGFYPILDWPEIMPLPTLVELQIDDYSNFSILKNEIINDYEYKDGENQYNTQIVKLLLNNPYGYRVENVTIDGLDVSNITTEFPSATNSEVYLKLQVKSNSQYINKYNLSSIQFTNGGEKSYKDDPYIIDASFYKEIGSVDEYQAIIKKINSNVNRERYWNYIVTDNLNFENSNYDSNYVIIGDTGFRGVFDGNNKVFSNITAKNNTVFAKNLYGTFKNIEYQNLKIESADSGNVGIISVSQYGSVVDNVHVENSANNQTFYIKNSPSNIGVIVAHALYSKITNCSVSNITISKVNRNNETYNNFTFAPSVGGIVGVASNTLVSNSYSYNFKYDQNSNYYDGATGALIGNLSGGVASNNISSGTIVTSSRSVGGLIGVSTGIVYNNITNVDITSTNNYVGGIVGNVSGTNLVKIYSNLSFGDIYSSNIIGFVGRIVGFYRTTSDRSKNFAYQGQSLNGLVSTSSDSETLLSLEELKNENTYKGLMGMSTNFDYSLIAGEDPKLPQITYSYDSSAILRKDKIVIPMTKESSTSNIKDVQASSYYDEKTEKYKLVANIYYLDGDKGYKCNDLNLRDAYNSPVTVENESLKLDRDGGNSCHDLDGGGIQLTFVVNHYLDNYKIIKLTLDSGEVVSTNIKINHQMYATAKSCDDLKKLADKSNVAQNIYIANDIDCGGTNEPFHFNLVNRFVGSLVPAESSVAALINSSRDGNKFTLEFEENVECEQLEDIIIDNNSYTASSCNHISDNEKKLLITVDDVNENITHVDSIIIRGKSSVYKKITRVKTGSNNFIDTLLSETSNILFDSFNIEKKNSSYVGIIGRNFGIMDHNKFTNNNITGYRYVGLIGSDAASSLNNIKADSNNIYYTAAQSNYIGGLSGYENIGDMTNIEVKNTNVLPNYNNGYYGTYIGGMFGSIAYLSTAIYSNLNLDNVTVVGSAYVGGAVGNGFIKNINFKNGLVLADSKDTKNYVGGIIGGHWSGATVTNSSFVNSTIVAHNINNVGGIAGLAYGVTNSTVTNSNVLNKIGASSKLADGAKYDEKIINNYIKLSDNKVNSNFGGIKGSGYSTTENNLVQDVVIASTNGTRVGGIWGSFTGSYTLRNSNVVNTTIIGQTYVGGIAGYMNYGFLHNNFVNAEISSFDQNDSSSVIGGIVGYLYNKGEAAIANRNYIYSNVVARTTLKTQGKKGAMVGSVASDVLAANSGRIYRNYFDLTNTEMKKTSNDYLIGNYTTSGYNFDGLRNGVDNGATNYVYNEGATLPTGSNLKFNYVSKNTIRTKTFYTDTLLLSTAWQYTFDNKIEYLQSYPQIKANAGKSVAFPSETASQPAPLTKYSRKLMARKMVKSQIYEHVLPNVKIYQPSVDKVNIEFSNVDNDSYFKIVYGDLETQYYNVTQRTFTFNYDSQTEFKVLLSDGVKNKEITFDPTSNNYNISVVGNDYYFIKNKVLYKNNSKSYEDVSRLYKNKIIRSGKVIDLYSGIESDIGNVFELDNNVLPLYEFKYNDYNIQTYATYSVSNGNVISNNLLFVKKNVLYTISNSLKAYKDTLVVDFYNNNKYEAILGEDNYLYNLNGNIFEEFNIKTKGIKYMTSTVDNDSNLVCLEYKDNSIMCLNYATKKVIYNSKGDKVPSLIEYLSSNLFDNKVYDLKDINQSYKSADTLVKNIKKSTVIGDVKTEEEADNIKNLLKQINVTENSNFVTTYDPIKKEVVVYEESVLLNNTDDNTVSISDKIIVNTNLKKQLTPKNDWLSTIKSGILIILSIFGLILFSTFLYAKFIKKTDK